MIVMAVHVSDCMHGGTICSSDCGHGCVVNGSGAMALLTSPDDMLFLWSLPISLIVVL